MKRSERGRVDDQPGFVLHTYPYRETSLVAEVFTHDHGRMGLIARGARRPRSALRGQLMEFQPLELSWIGSGELRTLTKAEWVGGVPLLRGRRVLFGYYLNELLLRLLAREDPHPDLHESYLRTVRGLAACDDDEALLRRFELDLLSSLGYGVTFNRDAESGEPVRADRRYGLVMERGMVEAGRGAADSATYSGRALIALGQGDLSDPVVLRESKLLMRTLINHYLGGQPLHSRRVLMELTEL